MSLTNYLYTEMDTRQLPKAQALGDDAVDIFMEEMEIMLHAAAIIDRLKPLANKLNELKDKHSELRFQHYLKTNNYLPIPVPTFTLDYTFGFLKDLELNGSHSPRITYNEGQVRKHS